MNTYDGFDGFMPPQRARHRGEARPEFLDEDGGAELESLGEVGLDAAAPEGERPILLPEQDLLGRHAIVKRMALMLAASDRQASRRMAVGVTGDWGVGKTSMLNLLEYELGERRPRPIVVRFEPWLAAGRNTLVTDFFTAFATVLGKERRFKEQSARAGDLMQTYGTALGGAQGAARREGPNGTGRGTTLPELRAGVAEALSKIDLPMVVLIDDVDSLDAADLRALTQVIRGLADFERLSFVLAYDEGRLTDILGAGAPAQAAQARARAHLEKLVQMQVPVPGVTRAGLQAMLEAELWTLFGATEAQAQTRMAGDFRLQELLQSMLPGAILKTPRDIKRVTGHVKTLAPVLNGCIDLADVVGFCALAAKAPAQAADISLFPERYVLDTDGFESDIFAEPRTDAERDPETAGLVRFLFPNRLTPSEIASLPRDRICFEKGLDAVLRLGAGAEVQELPEPDLMADLLSAGSGEIARRLTEAMTRGMGTDFVGRLAEAYLPAGDECDDVVWRGLLDGLLYLPAASSGSSGAEVVGRIAALFEERAAARPSFPAVNTLSMLINRQEWNVSARILRPYWQRTPRRREAAARALAPEDVRNLAFQYAMQARTAHTRNDFLPHLVSIAPVLLLIDLEVWDSEWRSGLQNSLINDTAETSARLLDLIFAPDLDVGRSARADIVGNEQIVGHLAQLWARRARSRSSGAV